MLKQIREQPASSTPWWPASGSGSSRSRKLRVRIARQAYVDFGKGNHPAGLNFGDCFAYALAKESGEPLLFKGDDFRRTDVQVALT
jgi:uncharacterized protein with PIN domain